MVVGPQEVTPQLQQRGGVGWWWWWWTTLPKVLDHSTQLDFVEAEVDASTHGVENAVGLLENLLQHEVSELAPHDLLELHLQCLHHDEPRNVHASVLKQHLRLILVTSERMARGRLVYVM